MICWQMERNNIKQKEILLQQSKNNNYNKIIIGDSKAINLVTEYFHKTKYATSCNDIPGA